LSRWAGEGGSQSAYVDPDEGGEPAEPAGRYRGRGPKGYLRSDERLHESVCERLTDDPDVDASEVSVQCKEGVVTLEGTVPTRWMKYRIEEVAEACPGVTEVRNNVRSPCGTTGRQDA
jgi:osmotically-inducible protein OsmY